MAMKCSRCGASFLFHRKIQLKDTAICGKCFNGLGFDSTYYLISKQYSYDEIKDGKYFENKTKELLKQAALDSVFVRMTGGERDLVCTEEEHAIFDEIEMIVDDAGADLSPLRLVRVSDNYLTAKYGEWDLARFKFTLRAKWVLFPTIEKSDNRHYIDAPEDVHKYTDLITETLGHIEKYSN